MYHMDSLGFKTWVTNVRNILQTYGFAYVMQQYKEINTCVFLSDFKKLSYEKYVHNWEQEIQKIDVHPILRFYCTFKTTFQIEPYLLCIKDPKIRKAISRFRLSSHDLHIEKGRYLKPKTPEHLRICAICNTGIENEKHFIEKCPLYNNLRNVLYDKLKDILGNLTKTDITEICLKSKNEKVLFYFGKYLVKCFDKRQTFFSNII